MSRPPLVLQTTEGEYFCAFSGPEYSFNNLHPSPFTVHGQLFNCAEQHFQWQKATHFGDYDIATRILATPDPKEQRALGGRVHRYNHLEWMTICDTVPYFSFFKKSIFSDNVQCPLEQIYTRSESGCCFAFHRPAANCCHSLFGYLLGSWRSTGGSGSFNNQRELDRTEQDGKNNPSCP